MPQSAPNRTETPRRVDVVIVGAGFAGHVHAAPAARARASRRASSRPASGVGGTWYWNRYPGARCDVESMQYSYSFSDELQQEWQWTRALRRAAGDPALRQPRRRPLRPAARHPVRHARHRGRASTRRRDRWTVATDRGDRVVGAVTASWRPAACPTARMPRLPGPRELRGRDLPHRPLAARGRRLHRPAGRRDRHRLVGDPVDPGDRRSRPAQLYVFQRTPNFSIPARNGAARPGVRAGRGRPNYAERRRRGARDRATASSADSNDAVGARGRRRGAAARLRGALGDAAAPRFMAAFSDLAVNKASNDTAAEFVREQDPRDRAATRRSPSCSRRRTTRSAPSASASTPTTTRPSTAPNVTLVDVRKRADRGDHAGRAAHRRTASTSSTRIVFATGFDAMTGALLEIDIRGRGGADAAATSGRTGRAPISASMVAGLPEPVHDHRPGQPVGAEQHDRLDRAARRLDRRLPRLPAARAARPHRGDRRGARTPGSRTSTRWPTRRSIRRPNSWYMGANIPGKPRVFMPYIGGVGAYRQKCDEVAANGYEGFELDAAGAGDGRSRRLNLPPLHGGRNRHTLGSGHSPGGSRHASSARRCSSPTIR